MQYYSSTFQSFAWHLQKHMPNAIILCYLNCRLGNKKKIWKTELFSHQSWKCDLYQKENQRKFKRAIKFLFYLHKIDRDRETPRHLLVGLFHQFWKVRDKIYMQSMSTIIHDQIMFGSSKSFQGKDRHTQKLKNKKQKKKSCIDDYVLFFLFLFSLGLDDYVTLCYSLVWCIRFSLYKAFSAYGYFRLTCCKNW